VTGNRIFEKRTQGVGVITAEEAIAYGASGPVLRASGVKYDVRKNDPYLLYDRYDFEVPVGKTAIATTGIWFVCRRWSRAPNSSVTAWPICPPAT